MAAYPRCERLPSKALGNVNVIVTFPSKIEDLGNINMTQLLSRRYLLFKFRALRRINAVCREQRNGNRLSRPLIHGFVAGCRTVAIRRVRRPVVLKPDTI